MPQRRLIPVFPLPDVMFFPGTVLPLHVFELRDRAMVADALAAGRTIAVALLRPGWERQLEGGASYFPIATAGRMEAIERTPDGRYYFRLAGVIRVRLGEAVREAPYRLVHAVELPEQPVDEDAASIRRAKLDLLASQVDLVRELTGNDPPKLVIDERISFEPSARRCLRSMTSSNATAARPRSSTRFFGACFC